MRDYWDRRYQTGGRSGERRLSERALEARYRERSQLIHGFADDVESVLDIGCGDGRQARWLGLPNYLGVDPSPEAIRLAQARNPEKSFEVLDNPDPRDLHLSLSVIFHLTDDADYLDHLALLFSALRYVIVDSTDHDEDGATHVRHRLWTPDVPKGWRQTMKRDRMTFWERA